VDRNSLAPTEQILYRGASLVHTVLGRSAVPQRIGEGWEHSKPHERRKNRQEGDTPSLESVHLPASPFDYTYGMLRLGFDADVRRISHTPIGGGSVVTR
jgi:hypothetical protein